MQAVRRHKKSVRLRLLMNVLVLTVTISMLAAGCGAGRKDTGEASAAEHGLSKPWPSDGQISDGQISDSRESDDRESDGQVSNDWESDSRGSNDRGSDRQVSNDWGSGSRGSGSRESDGQVSDRQESDGQGLDNQSPGGETVIHFNGAGSEADSAYADMMALPRRYDAREAGRTAPVRDQGELGTCWAFASLSALESRLLPEEHWDFSEDHMSHDPDFLLGQTGGGEYTMAMAYLLSGQGPVTEEQDPYGDGVSPQGLKPVKAVQEIRILPEGDREAIKWAVLRWGGVQSSLYTSLQNGRSQSAYYRPETFAYCYPGVEAPNHDVVIVGWDDDFPKEAFPADVKKDGAFFCENSWGTQFGDNGFFYVSYEDGNLGKNNVVYSGVSDPDIYDVLYQSDKCGWIGQLGYGEDTAWAANVYTAGTREVLAAAGFYATEQNTEYEVYVVRQVPDRPENAVFEKRMLLAEGHLEYAGFYTVPLGGTVELAPGERFAVLIRLTTPGTIHPVAIEYDTGENKCRIDLKDGEGYISADGAQWEHVEQSQNCNLCLKAYTLIR